MGRKKKNCKNWKILNKIFFYLLKSQSTIFLPSLLCFLLSIYCWLFPFMSFSNVFCAPRGWSQWYKSPGQPFWLISNWIQAMGIISRRLKCGRRERLGYFIPAPSLLLPCFLARSHHHHYFCHQLFPLWLHVSSCAIPPFFVPFLQAVKGASTSLVHSFILRIILNSYVKSCCIKVSLLNHLFSLTALNEMPESVLYSPSAHICPLFIISMIHLSSVFASYFISHHPDVLK